MSLSLHSTDRDGLHHLVAENARLRVQVLPACGGKILSIHDKVRDVEWMWHNPHLPLRAPCGSTRYVQEFDNGGWDECFPTIAPGKLKDGPFAGLEVHDHGELWSRAWTIERAECDESGACIELSTTLEAIPVRITRWLSVHPFEGVMRLEYRMQNLGDREIAYTWASHPLIPLEPGMRIETPEGTSFNLTLVGDGTIAPRLDARGMLALPDPTINGAKGQCFKGVFTGDFRQAITLRRAYGAGLSYRFGPEDFDGVALWCNAGAWSGCGSPPYNNIGFEPQVGLSDDLSKALAQEGHLARLPPHAARRWGLDVLLS